MRWLLKAIMLNQAVEFELTIVFTVPSNCSILIDVVALATWLPLIVLSSTTLSLTQIVWCA
ncbi:MAG TPA: hypothetical protein VJN70_13380, partial [Gemmatimonadaceae bacterium]|nr:hypothetical protein [Gemmatimonadaceae bacterium]